MPQIPEFTLRIDDDEDFIDWLNDQFTEDLGTCDPRYFGADPIAIVRDGSNPGPTLSRGSKDLMFYLLHDDLKGCIGWYDSDAGSLNYTNGALSPAYSVEKLLEDLAEWNKKQNEEDGEWDENEEDAE